MMPIIDILASAGMCALAASAFLYCIYWLEAVI